MSNAPPSKTGDCENCPEAQAAGQQPGYAHIIYTGGPAHVQYVVMRQLIPPRDPNIVTKYGWPSIRNDGGIEYSDGEMPPTPEGFEAVGPRLFRPLWPFCPYKILRARLQDTGLLEVEAICCHPPSGKMHLKALALTDCQNCPVRPAERTVRAPSRPGPPPKLLA